MTLRIPNKIILKRTTHPDIEWAYNNNRLVGVAPHKPAGSYRHGFTHTGRLECHRKMGVAARRVHARIVAGCRPISGRGSQKKLSYIRT